MKQNNVLETAFIFITLLFVFNGCNTKKAAMELGKTAREISNAFNAGYGASQ